MHYCSTINKLGFYNLSQNVARSIHQFIHISFLYILFLTEFIFKQKTVEWVFLKTFTNFRTQTVSKGCLPKGLRAGINAATASQARRIRILRHLTRHTNILQSPLSFSQMLPQVLIAYTLLLNSIYSSLDSSGISSFYTVILCNGFEDNIQRQSATFNSHIKNIS